MKIGRIENRGGKIAATVEQDGPRPWLQMFFEIQQNGPELKGQIYFDKEFHRKNCATGYDFEPLKGEVNAVVDTENSQRAQGQMKLCWDTSFWPTFVIDLEKGAGLATFVDPDGSEHRYTFKVERLTEQDFESLTGQVRR